MKFKNFTLNIAITYLLLLTSSAALAVGCGDGVLENETFDGSLIVDDARPCSIISSTIEGNLIVENGLVEGERIIVHGINKVYHGSLADPVTLIDYEAELAAQEEAQLQDDPSGEPDDDQDEVTDDPEPAG